MRKQKHHFGDFLQKTKMDIVFLLIVPGQVWHNNNQNMSYLRELEILHCFCFLHMSLRKWKTFADYFLLLEDLPDQLSYLCYPYLLNMEGTSLISLIYTT